MALLVPCITPVMTCKCLHVLLIMIIIIIVITMTEDLRHVIDACMLAHSPPSQTGR